MTNTSESGSSRRVVVVGVSPTSGSPTAVRWAAVEADQSGSQLLAVRAWRPPRPPSAPGGRPPGVSYDAEDTLVRAEAQLRSQVRDVLGDRDDILFRAVKGSPLAVLTRESVNAELLVIDAPPGIEFAQSPMLAHRLVYKAKCPVTIMPPALTKRRR